MKFQRSDIFASKNKTSSILLKNSSFSSAFQSRHIKISEQGQGFKVLAYRAEEEDLRKQVINRCNLAIEYIPQFQFVSQTPKRITIKINQYSLQLLPWLIKKDPLFKVNIVLGIYIAFLQLVDVYGLFPLHPSLMKVNQKQQVAVWINKNFEALEPDQVFTQNSFSMRQFMRSFLRIFRCCLPNKSTSQMYSDTKQLLNELAKIKRKQQMHKNCHEFIKHDSKLSCSRRSNKYHSTASIIQPLKQPSSMQRYSTKPNFSSYKSPLQEKCRFSSFSPPKKSERPTTSLQKFNQTTGFRNKTNSSFEGGFFKKKLSQIDTQHNRQIRTDNSNKRSICSKGELFKRYLMFNTTKYQKMSQASTPLNYHSNRNLNSKNAIFRSQVYKENENAFSQTLIQERNSVQVMSQQFLGIEEEKFSPVKFRKMSSNTNERKNEEQPKKFMNSAGWKKSSFKQQSNLFFAAESDENNKIQPKQRLKNSFPYKTASTINSFRLSNQHQYHIFPSKSEQNLNSCSIQPGTPSNQKDKDKKIEEMKIVEQNELENDFNNIFSMENSNVRDEQRDRNLEKIITEFEQVLF